MPKRRALSALLTALAALAGGLVAPPSHSAPTFVSNQQLNSFFDPEEDTRHPAEHTIAMVLNEDHPRGAMICVGYSHQRSTRPNRGRVKVFMRVFRSDRLSPAGIEVLEVRFGRSKVRDGRALVCKTVRDALQDGDGIEFEYRFKGRPPIRGGGGESAGVTANVRME